MYKNIKVEAEHNELILENSHGDKVIIPANKRNWVKQKLLEGCHNCIDSLVETLPVASQYAQDGSVYPPNKKVKINQNNQIKEYDINSPEYKDLYNSGKLTTYDKNTDSYIATPLKEVTITAEAPQWLKYKRDYEKTNPKSNYINSYLTPFAKSLGNTETNYPKRLDEEYEQKSLDYVSEQLVKNKPQGKLSRVEWLNQMFDKEEELVKRNPKYQSSLWADTKRGLTSLVEQNPLQTFQNILNSSDYTNREKQEMLKDYADHPIMSKLGDAAKIVNPLTIPSKMVQSSYKDDYSFADALKGKKNNAGIGEDIITDPLNLVGVGLVGKLSKADKVIDATKVGGKVLNKTDDVVKKLKFEDFNNDNEFFRIIVGDEAFDDIIKSGKVRVKAPSSKINKVGTINLDRRGTTSFPSFSKGKPSLEYANSNPNHYIIKTSDNSIKPSTSGRHGKGTTMFPTDDTGKHLSELDASKVQVYKHIGNGEYELVNTAKPIISSVDDVVKNLPKLEQIEPFKVDDKYLTKIRTDFHNNERILTSKEYLDLKIYGYGKPEDYKKLNYDIFKIPEKTQKIKTFKNEETKLLQYRDEYIDLITSNNNIEKAKLVDKRLGTDYVGAINKIKENKEKLPIPKYKEGFQYSNKGGEYSKQTNIVNKYKYKNVDGEVIKVLKDDFDGMAINVYNSPNKNTVWHEYRHMFDDIAGVNKNKNVVKELKDFMDVNEKGYSMVGNTISKLHNLSPHEIYTMLGTEFRMDLVERGILKNFDDVLTYDKLIKGNNLLNENFQNAIKDKEKFIKWFNNTLPTISLPAALYFQSQNQNKLGQ